MKVHGGLFLLCITGATSMWAAQFVPASDICTAAAGSCTASSYNGPNAGTAVVFGGSSSTDLRGVSQDGGSDAFDEFGWVANIGALSLNVHSDLITPANIFRWLVTVTNNTGSTINQTINFVGDYGSDSATTVQSSGPTYRVTSDNGPFDPVVGFVWGNNATALGFTITTGSGQQGAPNERVSVGIPVSLAAGQSAGYLFMAFLADDTTTRTGDIALATSTTQALLNTPNLTGLSANEINSIRNFGVSAVVPEPSTFALMGGALLAAGLIRRCRKK
jgi:hypothetical protein